MKRTLFVALSLMTATVVPSMAQDAGKAVDASEAVEAAPSYTEAQKKAILTYSVDTLLKAYDMIEADKLSFMAVQADPIKKLELEIAVYDKVSQDGLPEPMVKFLKERQEMSVKLMEALKKDKESEEAKTLQTKLQAYDQEETQKLGIKPIVDTFMQSALEPSKIMAWMAEYQTKHTELQTLAPEKAQEQITNALFAELVVPALKTYMEKK